MGAKAKNPKVANEITSQEIGEVAEQWCGALIESGYFPNDQFEAYIKGYVDCAQWIQSRLVIANLDTVMIGGAKFKRCE